MNKRLVALLLTLAAASPFGVRAQSNSGEAGASGGPVTPAGAPRPVFDKSVKGVRIWEQEVAIPTYMIGAPEPNPQFYYGGASQGAQERLYPYPAYDVLTTDRVDKPYRMVYLENEYVKIGVLPESGGKIFESVDKSNGYPFFYNQHVIKPALISLLGAWISGGVEWDVPHHHRATSFIPVQYRIEEDPDGSKTVWVGELELRDRMLWTVGVTLHPGPNTASLTSQFRILGQTDDQISRAFRSFNAWAWQFRKASEECQRT